MISGGQSPDSAPLPAGDLLVRTVNPWELNRLSRTGSDSMALADRETGELGAPRGSGKEMLKSVCKHQYRQSVAMMRVEVGLRED